MEFLENYTILETLGKGASGVFYSARDIYGQNVGIKVTTGRKIEQSLLEAEILENLTNSPAYEYVSHYYEQFFVDDSLYVVIELIDGITLSEFIKNGDGKYHTGILWPIYTQLILGLKAIHEQGVAHRDIKPENIMITPDYKVKFLDFGLACTELSGCNGIAGTPYYQPPEVLENKHEHTLQAAQLHDIWSLSLVLYNLANNRLPFIENDFDMHIRQFKLIMSDFKNSEVISNYNMDDGRTNIFLNAIIEPDVYERVNIDQLHNLFCDIILKPPFIPNH